MAKNNPTLIRKEGTNTVFAKEGGGWTDIQNPAEMKKKGYSFENVDDVSSSKFQKLTGDEEVGDRAPISAKPEDISLFRGQGQDTVYARTEKGMREVKNPETLQSKGMSFEDVTEVGQGTIQGFQKRHGAGPAITQNTPFSQDIQAHMSNDTDPYSGVKIPENPPPGSDEPIDANSAASDLGDMLENYTGDKNAELLKSLIEKTEATAGSEEEAKEARQNALEKYKESTEGNQTWLERQQEVQEELLPEGFQSDVQELRDKAAKQQSTVIQMKQKIESEKMEKQNALNEVSNMKGTAAAKQALTADKKAKHNREINRTSARAGMQAAILEGLNAQLKGKTERLTEARNLAIKAASAYTERLERNRRQLEFIWKAKQAEVQELNQDKRMWLKQSLDEAKRLEKMKRQDALTKQEWAIQYPRVFQGTNVLDMSLNEAASIAQKGEARKQRREGWETVTINDTVYRYNNQMNQLEIAPGQSTGPGVSDALKPYWEDYSRGDVKAEVRDHINTINGMDTRQEQLNYIRSSKVPPFMAGYIKTKEGESLTSKSASGGPMKASLDSIKEGGWKEMKNEFNLYKANQKRSMDEAEKDFSADLMKMADNLIDRVSRVEGMNMPEAKESFLRMQKRAVREQGKKHELPQEKIQRNLKTVEDIAQQKFQKPEGRTTMPEDVRRRTKPDRNRGLGAKLGSLMPAGEHSLLKGTWKTAKGVGKGMHWLGGRPTKWATGEEPPEWEPFE